MKKLLQVNSYDIGGGAEKVALDLHLSYLKLGLNSTMIVGGKKSNFPCVYEIPKTGWFNFWQSLDLELIQSQSRGAYRLHQLIKIVKDPFLVNSIRTGRENYHYPASRRMIQQFLPDTEIIHLHNLHKNYFDIKLISSISRKIKVIITMHDEYLYTGHCAYSLDCERWRIGCGKCPHLDVYPSIKRDNTRSNWRNKHSIFSASRITLVTPSYWLANRVKESLLATLPLRVIPNGVDLDVFRTGPQAVARNELGLAQDAIIILYAAAGGRTNSYKDYDMLDRVIARFQQQDFGKQVIFIALGGLDYQEKNGNRIMMIEKLFEKDPRQIAKHYQACDLYIHTAKADNAPLVILEAMACGKPIVATNAGGIPELVREGETGYTVPIGDDEAMVERILFLINNPDQLKLMGNKAGEIAKETYGLERMVSNYINMYQELIYEQQG